MSQTLREAAGEIIDQWQQGRAKMTRFAKEFFGIGLLDDSRDALTDLAKAVLPPAVATSVVAPAIAAGGAAVTVGSTVSAAVIGAAPGLAIGLVIYGLGKWVSVRRSEKNSKLRFLTKLEKLELQCSSHLLLSWKSRAP
jgi:hypothetical protein